MEEVSGLWKCTGCVCAYPHPFRWEPAHTPGDRIPGLLAIIPPELQFRFYLSNKSMKHKGKELQGKAGGFVSAS